jgi:transcriptional regulatory protein RtcR
MKTVAFGFLGTTMDAGLGAGRWDKWRPTIALCQHEDVVVDRLELMLINRAPTQNASDKIDALAQTVMKDIVSVSPETEVRLHPLTVNDPWDFGEMYSAMYDFVRAYSFVTDKEMYWIHITTGTHVAQICWFLLAESRHIPGVLVQASPPKRQANLPGSLQFIDLDLSRYDQVAQRFALEHADAREKLKSGIATRNAAFNAMIDEIERVAVRSKAPMLLMGPTGAGKSFLARRVYELKRSRHQLQGAFIDVNCATLRGEGAMSALFGHVKGAFTGAAGDRKGYLRSADQGLLFLDEIGELGLDDQAMLLKAIEEKRFFAVGGDREVASDFQLIAGTNRDLGVEVAQGRFREDLFARINLWTYTLPSLAQRREDIEPNIDFELSRLAQETHENVHFNTQARKRFLAFAASAQALWPGNFRDLTASVQRMATLAEAGRITMEIVETEISRILRHTASLLTHEGNHAAQLEGTDVELLQKHVKPDVLETIDLFDRVQLACVIRVCQQSRSLADAGRMLFAASRKTRSSTNDSDRIAKYLAKFGLAFSELR